MAAVVELEVGRGDAPGSWVVRVLRSAGSGGGRGVFEFDVDGLLGRLTSLEQTVLASSVPARRVLSPGESDIQRVGVELFDSLLRGDVEVAYRTSRAVALAQGENLQLRLRLTDPKLAAIPWETLYDRTNRSYVCRKDSLIRQIPSADSRLPLVRTLPLRTLAMVSSPSRLEPIDVEGERARLEQALAPQIRSGLIRLEWLEEVTWESLHTSLLSGRWHMIHFIGHSRYDAETDQGELAFCAAGGRTDWVGADSLADLIDEAEPAPRLVVLNSCASGATGFNELYSGTASALVRNGVDAVVAMQFSISDGAALAFATGFYAALAFGRTIDDATRSGRIAILGMGRDTLEWVTPVLCLRGEDTRLLEAEIPLPTKTTDAGAGADAASASADPERAAAGVAAGADPVGAEPGHAEPGDEGPGDEGPGDEGSGDAEPGFVEQDDAGRGDAEPDGAGLVGEADAGPGRAHAGQGPESRPTRGLRGAPRAPEAAHSPIATGDDEAIGRDDRGGQHLEPRSVGLGLRVALIAAVIVAVLSLGGLAVSLGMRQTEAQPQGPQEQEQQQRDLPVDTPSPTPTIVTVEFPVTSMQLWTLTEIQCRTGEPLRIRATGTVAHGATPDRVSGADGMPDEHRDTNVILEANHAALIGRIGESGQPFVVGSSLDMECAEDGPLYLGINDEGYVGNVGDFDVEVRYRP